MPPTLALELSPYLNLALRINDVVPVRRLSVTNDGPETLTDLRLELRANPAQSLAHDWPSFDLAPGQTLNLPLDALRLDYDFYRQLSEGLTAHVTASLYASSATLPTDAPSAQATLDLLATASADTRLLPAHHWGGSAGVPELLAAHVLPNDPAVARLLRRASELLASTGYPLDGYQSGEPRRAGAQALAILRAIREQDVHYVGVPRSFEQHGQRVRTPTEVIGDGLGNCLDLSALACAALEQAELHPGIVLVEGHAYLVCWLQPTPVLAGTVRDLQQLRKAEAGGLLLACESTALAGAGADVNAGVALGRQALAKEDGFREMVDVHAARTGEGVHPISQAVAPSERDVRSTVDLAGGLDLSALDHVPKQLHDVDTPVPRGAARVDQWKKRLLDLTRRNRLLNWRPLRSNLVLHHVDVAALEDALAAGVKFRFDVVDAGRGKDAALQRELGPEHYARAVREALASGVLLVAEPGRDVFATLIQLERNTRTAAEEGGANTLYVALGFAVKGSGPAAEYRAPLILLPVELRRRKAGNTFTLARRDEEAVLNPTLQELLRREHGVVFEGLTEELPQDEHGIDIPLVLAKARSVLLNVPGWEVEESVAVGEFSFAKYLMWRDLDRFERHLRENPVVAHLIERPREPYHVPGSAVAVYPERETLDQTFPVAEMLTPMSADASQLAAVRAASLGIDFVLEGPPGTGKSQTITNLIAQCLAEGKSVLFVSEKTAALEVVERRLNDIGLGEFCLELHSNKATKTHVYEQLRAAWAAVAEPPPAWAEEAQKLDALRQELNTQVEALHSRRTSGLSVFEAVSQANHPAAPTAPAPGTDWALTVDAARLEACRATARQLGVTLADVPAEAHNDLQPLQGPFETSRLENTARQVASATTELREAQAAFAKTLQVSGQDFSRAALLDLDLLAGLLPRARGRDYRRLAETVGSGRHRRNALEEAGLVRRVVGAYAKLKSAYRPEVAQLQAESLQARWRRSEEKFVVVRWWEQRGLRQELAAYSRDGEVDDVAADLATLVEIGQLNTGLQQLGAPAPRLDKDDLGRADDYAGFAGDWLPVAERAESLGLGVTGAERLLRALHDDGREGRETLDAAQRYRTAWAALEAAAAALTGQGCALQPADAAPAAHYPDTLARVASGVLRQQAHWRSWSLFAEARREAERLGMGYFAEALLGRASLGGERSQREFGLGFARVWADATIAGDPRLAGFSGSVQADRIARFRELDRRVGVLAQAEIRSRLLARRQQLFTQELRPHLAIWNSEREKKRRQLAVRPLIEGLGPLLTELTPCLLMSPLSVAQYLPPDRAIRFDVVVFDEASQIPVWDAVGAIARGRQVIVVGDSKQLPPTSFFEKAETDEATGDGFGDGAGDGAGDEGYARVEDMESILDEMQAASLQSRRLRWHYRSRAESLIAFSNRTYYAGELNTFPAPVAEDEAVQFHKVDSLDYHTGKNRAEAEALVAYLVERLRDPAEGSRTFGVVTFGMAQRTVIEDLLEHARGQYPELDRHFDPDRDERVFVKNIENVQGDERDVILFSITYGPDKSGKIRMAFGPMNSVGGERRLNVAVTRARQEMHVFASLEPEQIDLNRLGDNAQGARDLRRFLEFARRGSRAMGGETPRGSDIGDATGLQAAIGEALRAKGHAVDLDVGVSGYRVDLAVRNPEVEGAYLLGIELDGPGYRDAATARERDLLREAVLRGLGWRLERVWSLEWWFDRERVLKGLQRAWEEAALLGGEAAPGFRKRLAPESTAKTEIVESPSSSRAEPSPAEPSATEPMTFRPPLLEAGAYTRGIADVPLVELEALARELLPLGLDGDALVREMGVRIGLGSVRGSSRERVMRAVEGAWG